MRLRRFCPSCPCSAVKLQPVREDVVNHRRFLIIGAAVLAAALWFLSPLTADQPGQSALTPPMLNGIMKGAVKEIKIGLKKPTAKGNRGRIRTNAFVIAMVAQDAMRTGGPDTPKLAALREAALKLAGDTEQKAIKTDDASRQVAVLAQYPNIVAVNDLPRAPAPVDLLKHFEMADIMRMFDKPIKGGQGVEIQMLNLENVRRMYKPKQLKDWEPSAVKIESLAHVIHKSPVEGGAKKQKQWEQFSERMAHDARATLEAAKSKDSKQFRTALKKLNDSCTACHDVFK